jgi:hypothetical protein
MTRQSIIVERTLAKMMDTRVKPAYDGSASKPQRTKIFSSDLLGPPESR